MLSILRLAISAAVLISLGPRTALAAPAFTTKYSFYSVTGTSPTSIFASLLRNSQWVKGARYHALTVIEFPKPRTVSSARGCRVAGMSVRFLIRLPRLANEASLSAKDRRLWQQFSGFIRKHEETHRAFWMNCARRMDAVVMSLQGRNCTDVVGRARNIIEQIKLACRRKDIAFDAAEAGRFDNHPFMKAALAPIYTPIKSAAKKRKKSAFVPN